jgi:hypothetical protein
MSAKPCDRCTMIMVNYADLWLIHSHVAGLLDSARLELRELKARSILLGACTSCPMLRSDLEAAAIEIKDLKHKLDHPSRYTVLSPPYEACATKSIYRLGVGCERCEDKGEKSAPKFITSSTYHKEEATIKSTKAHYPFNLKPAFNPKREARKESPSRERKLLFACFVAVLVT